MVSWLPFIPLKKVDLKEKFDDSKEKIAKMIDDTLDEKEEDK